MDVLLIDIDSTIPNLALKKIEKYHLDKGDTVIWNMALQAEYVDKIYVSCIFPENKYKCAIFEAKGAMIGGTGYDLHITLPPEIDCIKPRINWGFTTRGCIRNCPFCFVPAKEGNVHIVGDIYGIWDGQSKDLVIMDNNILALPEHFFKICDQLRKEKLRVDFNQGLDHRLLTLDMWQALKSLHHIHEIRFSFDNVAYRHSVIKALDLMAAHDLKDWETRWYVYVGESDTFETVYQRIELLRSYKQRTYLMRDKAVYDDPTFIALSKWCNTAGVIKIDLGDLINSSEDMNDYAEYIPDYIKVPKQIPVAQGSLL